MIQRKACRSRESGGSAFPAKLALILLAMSVVSATRDGGAAMRRARELVTHQHVGSIARRRYMPQNDSQDQREVLAGPGDRSGLVGQPTVPDESGLTGSGQSPDESGLVGAPRSPNESGLVRQPTSPNRSGLAGSDDVSDELGLLGGQPAPATAEPASQQDPLVP